MVRAAASLLLFVCVGASCGATRTTTAAPRASLAARLAPDPARLAAATPDLRRRLAASPIALFRFVNQAWTREVCAAFARDLPTLPPARLHGDAHVEQYAVTATARGLDDFDDSARGPAVVDIVRFLGSLELTARERGWVASLPSITEAFFEGYRRALADPSYLPPDPAVVVRLRASPARSPEAFLAWADSLMVPLAPSDQALLDAAWAKVEAYAIRENPDFTSAFLARRKVGGIRLGIGSALTRKLLLRIEGPSPAPGDDVVIEAKEVLPLRAESCVSVPPGTEPFRIVEGLRQIGRLQQRLLVAMPVLGNRTSETHGWWVKEWERSYRELEIADLASADELKELAHDVGAQLGGTNLLEASGDHAGRDRRLELEGVTRLEPKMRQVSHDLTLALLGAWERLERR